MNKESVYRQAGKEQTRPDDTVGRGMPNFEVILLALFLLF